MINTFLRSKCVSLLKERQVSQIERVVHRLASFTARHILQETSDEAGTLLTRFAKHVALELQNHVPIVPTVIRYADYFPITDTRYLQKELTGISPDQLPALIVFAFTYRPSADPNKYATLLNELDATAIKLLPKMDLDTILRTLYAFLYLMPNWIVRIDFYNAAMERILAKEISENLSKERFVQICFYLGLEKNRGAQNGELFHKLLNTRLDSYLPVLSTLDLVMVANAAFKTSTRIESNAYNQRLIEEVLKLSPNEPSNDALLVTLVKALRLQRVYSEEVFEYLKEYCSEDIIAKLQTRGCTHLFAYFADNLWDEQCTIEPLVKHCLRRLVPSQKFDMVSEHMRGKDLAKFLWCCAQLNCKIPASDLKRIELILLDKVDQNEFRYFVDQLVESCLSLWILGHKSFDLIEAAVSIKLRSQFSNKNYQKDLPKVESRFQVLLTCIAIEEPTWRFKNLKTPTLQNFDTPAPSYLLKNRSDLEKITNKIGESPIVDFAKLVCPINGINIPSILVSYKEPANSKMFVEFLSEDQELKFSKSPVGLMRLKIRLLKAMGYKVTTLAADDYDENNLEYLLSNVEADDVPKAQSIKV
ncbi:uncharacterized protein LOC129248439 [Anastrepha obliqua]|uniref:uncharacterized protein LOC129248439 n=1 Tax=Anastrepha obliqua TaxID=95512 RepID=UPI00240A3038|nr:uncharacterized protein LOC129248439 [Anastrepha obliqua]